MVGLTAVPRRVTVQQGQELIAIGSCACCSETMKKEKPTAKSK